MSRLFLLESAVIPRRYVLSRRLLRVRSPEWGKLLLKRKRRFALLYLAAGYRCGVQIIGVDAGGYDHDRAYRVVEHGLRGGAQQHAGEATPAARSQIGRASCRERVEVPGAGGTGTDNDTRR